MEPNPTNPEQPSNTPPPQDQPGAVSAPVSAASQTPASPTLPSSENSQPEGGGAAGPVVSGSFDASPASPPLTAPVTGSPANRPPVAVPPKKRSRGKKPFVVVLVLLLLLIGGAAAFYFGYYTNPSVVLSQSLNNTGKGYAKVVDYFNQQSKTYNNGSTASGSYKLKSSSFSTDGNLSFQSDGKNSQTTFDVGAGITRVNVEVRTIKSAGTNPDIYLKANGIKGLGGVAGPSIDAAVNQLDGKWIVIDHTLLDNIEQQASQTQKPPSAPTQAQILDEVNTFGRVNQQYVFTTDKNKAVATVVKKYGIETIDGHKVYHYKMALVKANVKSYITAQRDALKANSLGAWLQQNGYLKDVNDSYDSLQKSADSINSSDTFDLWSDINSRLVYKVRVSDKKNPAANYADIGLDYKGGPSYPFFVSGKSDQDGTKTTVNTVNMVATLNSQTKSIGLKVGVNSTGTDSSTFTADLTAQPSSKPLSITAPSGAEPLSQVLDELGIGDLLNNLVQSANSLSSPNLTPSTSTNPPTILN